MMTLQSLIQIRSEQTSLTDRESLRAEFRTLERTIQEHVESTKRAQEEIERRKLDLRKGPEDEGDDEAQRVLARKEVEEQSCLLEADQISSGVVFSQVHRTLTGQDIINVITTDDSKALVGLPQGVVGKVSQRIRDVRTERNSAAVVGVFADDVDMRDFLKK
jgi:hypothetical protein